MSDTKESIIKQTSQAVDEYQAGVKEGKENARSDFEKKYGAFSYLNKQISQRINIELSDPFPTGYKKLDEILDGGLYPGLYILGAVSSLGKTSFILQMADQIASSGTDVLYFSLEMAGTELVSRSLSRLSYEMTDRKYLAKTSRELSRASIYSKFNDREQALMDKVDKAYFSLAKHLYIFEGVGDIGASKIIEHVKKHRDLTNRKAVVMIDYLQILAPHDVHYSDKQNTDKAVLELKRMSRDLNIPVITISSFNRDSYSNEVSMTAYKESGAVEYGSDVLIALQPQGMKKGYTKQEQKHNLTITQKCKHSAVRKIELVILKNRSGETEGRLGYDYRAKFNHFTEDPEYKPKQEEDPDREDENVPSAGQQFDLLVKEKMGKAFKEK